MSGSANADDRVHVGDVCLLLLFADVYLQTAAFSPCDIRGPSDQAMETAVVDDAFDRNLQLTACPPECLLLAQVQATSQSVPDKPSTSAASNEMEIRQRCGCGCGGVCDGDGAVWKWRESVCGVACATWAIRRDGVDGRDGQHLVLGGPMEAQSLWRRPVGDCASEIVSYSGCDRDVGDDGDDGGRARTSAGARARKNGGAGGSVEAWMP